MKKLTAEEILERIEKMSPETPSNFITYLDYTHGDDAIEDEIEEELKNYPEIGEMEIVDLPEKIDTHDFCPVVYFKDHDIYIKFYGWHDSYAIGLTMHKYNDINFSPKEVKLKSQTITVYE